MQTDELIFARSDKYDWYDYSNRWQICKQDSLQKTYVYVR